MFDAYTYDVYRQIDLPRLINQALRSTTMITKEEIQQWFMGLQDTITTQISATDGVGTFIEDSWERHGGGGGRTRILTNGRILAKAGVGFSAVYGQTPKKILQALNLPEADFFATGVSIVMHPNSPLVPIIHMNVRYFEMTNGTCWFGGGIDLTPHYINPKDARWFHQQMKAACDAHDPTYYPKYKPWADDYFYIKHRQETRGIGGIFFDHLMPTVAADGSDNKAELFSFVQSVGNAFAPTYSHFMTKNHELPYTEAHQKWQALRRGRYVEFNLVLDKGTKFGLDTDGRTESILMSMPPMAQWVYDHKVEPASAEEYTQQHLQKGIDWLTHPDAD